MTPSRVAPQVKFSRFILLALALPFLLLPKLPAFAETVRSSGEHNFSSMTTTGNEACKKALEKAKFAAVSAVAGETVSSQQFLRCAESDGEDQCKLNSSTWSSLRGRLTALREISKKIRKSDEGFEICQLEIEANVEPFRGNRDPNLDFNVELNSSSQVYREGEKIRFSIKPLQPLYLNIFLWDPYEKSDRKVVKIFPNQFDKDNYVKDRLRLPRATSFETTVVGAPSGRKSIEQFLMFVGTRKKVEFLESYRVNDLNQRLLEIPTADWREKRKGFLVIRGKTVE